MSIEWKDATSYSQGEREQLLAKLDAIELGARNLNAYLKWQLSDESPGYAPTFPSAVAHFRGQFDDWVFAPGHAFFEQHQQERRAASIPAPERSKEEMGVRIKLLEWWPFTSDEDVSFMFAAAFGVRYEVFHKASDVAKIGIQVARMQHVDGLLSDDDDGDETTTIIGYGKDMAAAYAIAQADFDTLVLSALETPPLHKEGEAVKHSDECGCGYCT